MSDDLATEISNELKRRGYTWKINGVNHWPSVDLVRKNLDGLKRSLYDEDDGTMRLLGRILVWKRSPGKFDIYLMIGEDNDS